MHAGQAPLIVPTSDQQRISDTWRLRMMLEGTWRHLLAEHGYRQLGPVRAALVGEWDTGANLMSNVVDQTSTMYDAEPQQQHDDETSLDVLRDSFERGGWWTAARQHQRFVRGLRESVVFVGWDPSEGHPTFSLVTPDMVTIDAAPENRSRPITIWRAQERSPGGQKGWFWDRWSIAGGEGSFSIWSNDRRKDVTAAFFDPSMWRGPSYPYRDEAGRPILPAVLYHAVGGGTGIWNPHLHQEMAFGTLQIGLLWTAMVHGFLRASWDQRVIINGRVRGGALVKASDQPIRIMTPDPTGVLEIEGVGGTTAAIDQWGAALDIEAAEQTVRRYESRLAVHFGLSPSDLSIESMSPASGASISISRAGKREIALRDQVTFRRGDTQLAEVVAAVNRAWGRPCSATGYHLRYRGLGLTQQEREAASRWVKTEMELGLLDRVAAYQELHPGCSTENAIADLEEMERRKEVAEARERVVAELAGGAAQDSALNGAQVQSLVTIVQSVAANAMPRDAAVAIVQRSFNVDLQSADRLLGSAGRGFVPQPQPPGAPAVA